MRLIKWNNEPIFSDFMQNFFDRDLRGFFPEQGSFRPATNVVESETGFELELAIPGMSREDFKIDLENNTLTISSEKKEENESKEKNYTRKEFVYGSFTRSFTLPKTVDSEKIKAEYKNGILHVDLPKKEDVKTVVRKEIAIA